MQSKLCAGLYFAGEVLDVDARTGGYNLQIAWATAQAAVRAIGNDTYGVSEKSKISPISTNTVL